VGQAGTGSSGDRSRRRHTTAANGRVESASATGTSLAGDHQTTQPRDSQWQVTRRYLSEGSMAKLTQTSDDDRRPKEVKRATAELVAT
jgi:hypothetical protein